MIRLLDEPLLKSLMDGTIPFHEVMNAYGINTAIAFNLPSCVYGFVYRSNRKGYLLVLNGNINYETQCRIFLHEISHIVNDMPNMGYIIGLDMQNEQFEMIADNAIMYMGE